MNVRLSVLAAATVALGCASTQRVPPPASSSSEASRPARSTADAKRELLAALERELEPLQTRQVQGPNGQFTGAVEASAPVSLEENESYTVVDIPLGDAQPIKCFVYRDRIDVGQSLQSMIATLEETLEIQAIRPVEIGAAGDRPALFLELDYTYEDKDGVRPAGQMKILAAPDDDLPLVCFHDALGYRRSFRRIAQAFAASIEPRGKSPRFAEIQVYKVNDLPVGFEHRRIWEAEKDQTILETTSLLMTPRSKKELAFQDTLSSVVADARERITQYSYAKAVNGELVVHATLERRQGNTYAAQGTKDGKEFSASLTSKDKAGLPSELLIQHEVKASLLNGRKPELVFETYSPGTEPTALRELKYRKTETSARSVTLEMNGATLEGEVDEHGTVERLDLPLSATAKMRMDRVLAQGTP